MGNKQIHRTNPQFLAKGHQRLGVRKVTLMRLLSVLAPMSSTNCARAALLSAHAQSATKLESYHLVYSRNSNM